MRKIVLTLGLIVICFQIIIAQRTITGRVTSDIENQSMPGTTIYIVGTTLGTVTDIDGNYEIDVPEGSKRLLFKFVKFKDAEAEIGNRNIINIVMEEQGKKKHKKAKKTKTQKGNASIIETNIYSRNKYSDLEKQYKTALLDTIKYRRNSAIYKTQTINKPIYGEHDSEIEITKIKRNNTNITFFFKLTSKNIYPFEQGDKFQRILFYDKKNAENVISYHGKKLWLTSISGLRQLSQIDEDDFEVFIKDPRWQEYWGTDIMKKEGVVTFELSFEPINSYKIDYLHFSLYLAAEQNWWNGWKVKHKNYTIRNIYIDSIPDIEYESYNKYIDLKARKGEFSCPSHLHKKRNKIDKYFLKSKFEKAESYARSKKNSQLYGVVAVNYFIKAKYEFINKNHQTALIYYKKSLNYFQQSRYKRNYSDKRYTGKHDTKFIKRDIGLCYLNIYKEHPEEYKNYANKAAEYFEESYSYDLIHKYASEIFITEYFKRYEKENDTAILYKLADLCIKDDANSYVSICIKTGDSILNQYFREDKEKLLDKSVLIFDKYGSEAQNNAVFKKIAYYQTGNSATLHSALSFYKKITPYEPVHVKVFTKDVLSKALKRSDYLYKSMQSWTNFHVEQSCNEIIYLLSFDFDSRKDNTEIAKVCNFFDNHTLPNFSDNWENFDVLCSISSLKDLKREYYKKRDGSDAELNNIHSLGYKVNTPEEALYRIDEYLSKYPSSRKNKTLIYTKNRYKNLVQLNNQVMHMDSLNIFEQLDLIYEWRDHFQSSRSGFPNHPNSLYVKNKITELESKQEILLNYLETSNYYTALDERLKNRIQQEKHKRRQEKFERIRENERRNKARAAGSSYLSSLFPATSSSGSTNNSYDNSNKLCYTIIEEDKDWAGNIDYKVRCKNGDIKTVYYNKDYNRYDNGRVPNTFNLKTLAEAAKSACYCD